MLDSTASGGMEENLLHTHSLDLLYVSMSSGGGCKVKLVELNKKSMGKKIKYVILIFPCKLLLVVYFICLLVLL